MDINRKKFKNELTTGFGTSSNTGSGRFYRKDGSANVLRRGVPFFNRFSWFHTMLSMSPLRFWLSLTGVYVGVNLLFAVVYFLIGVEHLNGTLRGASKANQFIEAFFFSAQTYTTVGYGHVSPDGIAVSSVAAFESFLGVMTLALASGIFFGRFSMPRAFLRFSSVALIAPFKEGEALMFRMVPEKNNQLTDAEVKLTLALQIKEGNRERNEFYSLPVEFNRINTLVLNWTVVHPINEDSPLHGYTVRELAEMEAEILVFVKAYDEVFANSVVARTSYTADEIIPNARFRPMYHSSGQMTVLEVDKLNDFDLLPQHHAG
ncbi:Inward rectifier potassium channel Irk [Flaviaesturariibacter flavus]|uniref:Inward rectifier potassium channel Irk n=1 Tax=Flaviaesturariibacter flavus TaxID=2502780 RepID=A0A4R1BP02_9BACT|nr:ion channel [Flaviaesturariibacter flavus]TCJ19299.1 Inward rectifier potassium channel Irk [Flaviaesturariibacter flavus]